MNRLLGFKSTFSRDNMAEEDSSGIWLFRIVTGLWCLAVLAAGGKMTSDFMSQGRSPLPVIFVMAVMLFFSLLTYKASMAMVGGKRRRGQPQG
jgi:hypothetical protein